MRKENKKGRWLVVVLGGVFLLTLFPRASFASRYTVPKKEDIYIDFAYQHTNLNSRPYLLVADYTNPSTSRRTLAGAYIKFENIPHHSGQELVKAEWHFRVISHLGNNEARLRIRPAAHSWNATEVTWARQPASLFDTAHSVLADVDLSTGDWKTVDITPLVRGWLDGSLDPDKGMSVFRYNTGWLMAIGRRGSPSYLTVEYRDNIGEGGGDEMGHTDDSDDGVTERTEVLHLIFPGDGEKITDQTPTFVWSERNHSYDLSKLVLVLKKENGDRVFDAEVDLNGTSYTSDRRLSPGKYQWYLKGYWNGEEVYKTDRNKFEIVAGEKGLTAERGAVEEETVVDHSETETNVTPATSTNEVANQTTSSVNASETDNSGSKSGNPLNIYQWLIIILLLVIAGLLGWMAKNRMTGRGGDDRRSKGKKRGKKGEERKKAKKNGKQKK